MPQNKVNYQKQLDRILERLKDEGRTPRLLLHSCCAPCSSYVLEYLSQYFAITVFYYNPNISPLEEYEHRKAEQIRLIEEGKWENPVQVLECPWDAEKFSAMAEGLETAPEGGARCFRCYALRLEAAAEAAKSGGYDYFCSTLSISPLKNAQKLNEIGNKLAERYDVLYLPSDFKKREGYKRSIELSREYGLYRQDYCGCVYSRMEREREKSRQGAEG